MSSEKAKEEALAILEEQAKQRIDDIRQRVEFACTTLRAQGNTQINQLLLSVRQLTMHEFCHLYGADTAVFLQANQKRLRQRPEPVRLKRKAAVVVNSKPAPPPPAQVEPVTKAIREVATATATATAEAPSISKAVGKDNIEVTGSRVLSPSSATSSATSAAAAAAPSSSSLLSKPEPSFTPTKRKRHREEPAEEPIKDFGPVFVHLERKDHPRIAFTLDPQQSIDTLGSFALHMPQAELFDQMDARQRDNLRGQVEDIRHKLGTILDQL